MNDLKITAVYFLAYPDCNPPDPNCAYSEVRIEVGGPNSRMNDFEKTYSLIVATPAGLARRLIESPDGYLAEKKLLIVPQFDDVNICSLLERLLPQLPSISMEH